MSKSIFISILLLITACFITSCEGDCKDEQIEKAEWITTYTDKIKDTLAAYSITESKREYIKLYDEVRHSVTIRNNNTLYSGQFSLIINYGYLSYYNTEETKTEEFDYVFIAPRASYTFTYYTQAGKYANFNSSYIILQKPVSFTYKERKDELKAEIITVNTCQENVEALREKYKAVKDLYESKKN